MKKLVKSMVFIILVNNMSINVMADELDYSKIATENYGEVIREGNEGVPAESYDGIIEEEEKNELFEEEEIDNSDNVVGDDKSKNDSIISGWVKKNWKWYYYNSNGDLVKGWLKEDNKWYYLNQEGVMEIGWKKIDGLWYYLNPNGDIRTGWFNDGGKKYYLKQNGEMIVGWGKINGTWYYFNTGGAMETGWIFIDNQWYYLNEKGEMQFGWQKINGQWYYLNDSGDMALNKVVEGWYLNDNGVGSKVLTEGSYGQSGKGRSLDYYKIGSGNKVLIAVFGVHGFEDAWKNDGAELKKFAFDAISKVEGMYNNNEKLDYLSKWTVYIIPSANPDGLIDGWTNYGPGRATITTKIDINRSFPVGFKKILNNNRNYTGSSPLIAPEARALYNFINDKMRNAEKKVLLDVHGWENKTIGSAEIGKYFGQQFNFPNRTSYPGGFIISYGNSIGAKSSLVEFPYPKSKQDIINRDFSGKFSRGLMNILLNE